MGVSQQTLLLLSAIGALNGTVLSSYILATSKRKPEYLMLALLLYAISIRIGKSVLFYFNPNIEKQILQVGLTACFFIGPLLFLYAKHHREKPINWLTTNIHLGLLITVSIIVSGIYPYSSYPEMWGNVIYKSINYIWLFYLIITLIPLSQMVKTKRANQSILTFDQFLLISVYIGVSLIWLAYFTASYTSYIAGALSFSLCLYLTLLLSFRYYQKLKQTKYVNKVISDEQLKSLTNNISEHFQHEQHYLNPDLTLNQLAKRLSVSKSLLSQYINQQHDMSFNQFINQYRIQHACSLLKDNTHLSIDHIAEKSGFNSMSTFYSAFKKYKQCTPKQFKSKLTNSSN